MSMIYRSLIVLAVFVLIIMGLNTSSQGISSLTAESRSPVVGVKIENRQLNVFALGEQYSISRQDLSQGSQDVIENSQLQFNALIKYLKKIWTIFEVLFIK